MIFILLTRKMEPIEANEADIVTYFKYLGSVIVGDGTVTGTEIRRTGFEITNSDVALKVKLYSIEYIPEKSNIKRLKDFLNTASGLIIGQNLIE